MARTFGLLGVPSSAGARTPGQEKGPAALRAAGLLELLDATGLEVRDHGDLPLFRWRPDPTTRTPQNLAAVVSVASEVAGSIEGVVRDGEIPLVVGGDCTITVGVIAGMLRAGLDPSLLYVDGGVDLYVPGTQPAGHMDSMGVAHLLDEPGAARELAGIGPTTPMLEAEQGHVLRSERGVRAAVGGSPGRRGSRVRQARLPQLPDRGRRGSSVRGRH